jgi:hypothetical protein
MRDNKLRSFKAAFGGIIAALSIVFMFSTGIIPTLTYAIPAICGALLMAIVIEINPAFASAIYVAVSILSLLVVADKEAALLFAIFLGYYPTVKGLIERLKSKVWQYVIKFLLFNATMIGAFYIGTSLLSIPKESFNIFGVYLPWLFLIIGNVVFVIYDLCITRLVTIYLIKWHNRLNKNTKL